jgi:hypothetical protein
MFCVGWKTKTQSRFPNLLRAWPSNPLLATARINSEAEDPFMA